MNESDAPTRHNPAKKAIISAALGVCADFWQLPR